MSQCPTATAVFIAACVLFAAMTALLVYQLLNQKDSKSRTDKFTKEKQYAAVHMALVCTDPAIEDPKDLLKEAQEKEKASAVISNSQNASQVSALSAEGMDNASTKVTNSSSASSRNGVAVKIMSDTVSSRGSVRVDSENLAASGAVAKAQMMNRESAEYRRYLEQRNEHALWMSSRYNKKEVDGVQLYEILDLSFSNDSASANEELALIWMHHNFCQSGNKDQRQQAKDEHDIAADNRGTWRACQETAYNESDGAKNRSGTYLINDGFELPQGRVNYLDHLLQSLDGIIDDGIGNLRGSLDRLKDFNELLSIAQTKMRKKNIPEYTPRPTVTSEKAKNYGNESGLVDNDVLVGDSGLGISGSSSVSPDDLSTYSSLSHGGDVDAAATGQKAAGNQKAKGILNSLLEKLKKLKQQQKQSDDRKSNKRRAGKNRGKGSRGGSSGSSSSSSAIDPNDKAEILNDDSANGAPKMAKDEENKDSNTNGGLNSGSNAWQDFMNKYGQNGNNASSSGNGSSYNNKNESEKGDLSGLSDDEKADIENGLRNQKALEVNDGDSLWAKITKTYQKRAYPTLLKLKNKKGRR